MFNFSANHLFLLSRTEYRTCAVFFMLDRLTRAGIPAMTSPNPYTSVRPILLRGGKGQQRGQTLPGGRIGQAGHQAPPVFTTPAPADGAGGSLMK